MIEMIGQISANWATPPKSDNIRIKNCINFFTNGRLWVLSNFNSCVRFKGCFSRYLHFEDFSTRHGVRINWLSRRDWFLIQIASFQSRAANSPRQSKLSTALLLNKLSTAQHGRKLSTAQREYKLLTASPGRKLLKVLIECKLSIVPHGCKLSTAKIVHKLLTVLTKCKLSAAQLGCKLSTAQQGCKLSTAQQGCKLSAALHKWKQSALALELGQLSTTQLTLLRINQPPR